MDQEEFKQKLDTRQFWRVNSQEMWDAAYKWQQDANGQNKNAGVVDWVWDCGLKLDYDGSLCSISSRFYPPHKSHEDFGKYSGIVCLVLGDFEIHEHSIEASTLDELQLKTENYVHELIGKVESAVKSIFETTND